MSFYEAIKLGRKSSLRRSRHLERKACERRSLIYSGRLMLDFCPSLVSLLCGQVENFMPRVDCAYYRKMVTTICSSATKYLIDLPLLSHTLVSRMFLARVSYNTQASFTGGGHRQDAVHSENSFQPRCY